MGKKDYEKPTMRVIELQHTGMLMTSGVVEAERRSYGTASGSEYEQTWE